MSLAVDDSQQHCVLTLVGPYIYTDRDLLDNFICDTLSVETGGELLRRKASPSGVKDLPSSASVDDDDDDNTEDDSSFDGDRIRTHHSSAGERAAARARKAQAPGECYRCSVHETPQWRYVHHLRFCNACYMRIKRFTEQTKPGYKLPPRAKPSSIDNNRMAQLALDLARAAFA